MQDGRTRLEFAAYIVICLACENIVLGVWNPADRGGTKMEVLFRQLHGESPQPLIAPEERQK